MAFSVTPTSGDAPYVLFAEFENDYLFGNGYRLEVRFVNGANSCPVNGLSGMRVPLLEETLLSTGEGVSSSNVAANFCRAFSASVVTDEGDVLQTATVFVSNVVP